MLMTPIDWLIVVAYCVLMVVVGVIYTKRASKGTEDFFISGRSLNWWLMGTSIIATAFSSDTPLFITNLVRRYGIGGAWYYWNMTIVGLIVTFLYVPLWRRTRAVTDAEVREMRYGKRGGRMLRMVWAGLRAFMGNPIGSAWVLLSMIKITQVVLNLPEHIVIAGYTLNASAVVTVGVVVISLVYSVMSGMWGVVVNDFIQFIIAAVGIFSLAFYSIKAVGGQAAMQEQLMVSSEAGVNFLRIVPRGGTALIYFLGALCVQWWSSQWADGGIEVAQRTLSVKNEWHGVVGRYWGLIGLYSISVWPWIIVALCSILLLPAANNADVAADGELAYPKMVVHLLPPVLRGLMVSAFLAAFMSTISGMLNLGSSYFVNDLYKRAFVKNASERHYVLVARIAMVAIAIISGIIAYNSKQVLGLSQLLLQLTAGIGLVFLLRWFWWRISAWSELSAYISSAVGTIALNTPFGRRFLIAVLSPFEPEASSGAIEHFITVTLAGVNGWPLRLLCVASFTSCVWVIVTFLTSPTDEEDLIKFYRKVKPFGPGWRRIAALAGPIEYTSNQFRFDILALISGTVFFYSTFVLIGQLWLGFYLSAIIATVVGIISGIVLWWRLMRQYSDTQD